MKRTTLTIAYLTVMTLPAFAQLPTPLQPADTVLNTNCLSTPARQTHQLDEYVPLSNEPFFPGGQQALQAYMRDPDFYPHQARQSDVEGTVRVQFQVLPTGHLTKVRVIQSAGPLLDRAAIEAVALMPRWYPAHRSGVAVAQRVELPITFHID